MKENHDRQKPAVTDVVSMGIGIVMVVLYITLGTTIIFKGTYIPNIKPLYTQLFGVMLICYGLFRGYKVYRKHFFRSEF